MDTLLFALNAVLPILILIGFGYLLKRSNFLKQDFIETANKLVFRIALPCLLFFNIYSIDSLDDINWSVIIYAVIGILILFALGFIAVFFFIEDKKQKGVIIQSTLRANFAIIGIPLAESIGGQSAVANVAIIALVAIPLMTALSVISLSTFVDEAIGNPFINAIKKVSRNPLIIGVLMGMLALWIRSFIPVDEVTQELVFSLKDNLKFIYTPIRWIGQITSPLALIVLGATFKFDVINGLKKQIVIGTFLRSILAPIITLTIGILLAKSFKFFDFDSSVYPALISLFGSPTAVTNAVMAREMKNDEALAVQLVVWTTLVSIVTIFIIIVIFRSLKLI